MLEKVVILFRNSLSKSIIGTRYSSVYANTKRFYKNVSVADYSNESGNPSYAVLLDNRQLKSLGGNVLKVESEPLALAIATEWDAQKEYINKTHMRLTGLTFTALDNPFHETKETLTDKMMKILDTDTVLYFADDQESLVNLQKDKWAPIIKNVNDNHDIDIRATQNITDTPLITDKDRLRIQRWLLSQNFWALTGFQYGVEAAKSMIIMMALNSHQITVEEATEAARLEQIYQTKIWGNVEWSHDIEYHELATRLSAAVLFTYFSSNHAVIKKFEAST